MTLAGPTNVRGRIIAVSMLMAFILYLDRICLAEIVKSASFHAEVALSPPQIGRVLGIFFFAYALFQVPAGWVSDRFGARGTLAGYIAVWSLFTAVTGMVSSFPALLAARVLCGAAEAGAYPTSGALLRRWVPLRSRARANSLVTIGGRLGGTLAPFLTAWLVVSLGRWRPVLWLDGSVGLAIAVLYWAVVRNRPDEHPGCDAAERALIGHPADERPPSAGELGGMLRAFLRSRSLWCTALVFFCVNFGWAFLITWLPTYLQERQHVEPVAGGRMVTLVLAGGMVGQLIGGWLTDRASRRLGLKWGRIFALAASGVLGGCAYLACLVVHSAWSVVACCGLVSLAVDMGNPAIWSVIQDVGGRITATAFGWINMWGNFGAAFIAMLVPTLVAAGSSGEAGQREVFLVCAGSLFLSALVACGIDAGKPLVIPLPTPL